MSAEGISERHGQVMEWLQNTLGETPCFEANETTLDILHAAMCKSSASNKRSMLLCADAKQRQIDYDKERTRLSLNLSSVGLSSGVVDKPSSMALESLASVANSIQLDDVHWASFHVGLSQVNQTVEENKMVSVEAQQQQDEMMVHIKQALVQVNSLKQLHGRLAGGAAAEAETTARSVQEVSFCSAKAQQYNEETKDLKLKLRDCGFQQDLEHQRLCQSALELEQRKVLLQPLKAKLKSFHTLPADMRLSAVKLEQLRQDVDALEQQLSVSINLMNS